MRLTHCVQMGAALGEAMKTLTQSEREELLQTLLGEDAWQDLVALYTGTRLPSRLQFINTLFETEVWSETEINLLVEWLTKQGRIGQPVATVTPKPRPKKVPEVQGRFVPVDVILNTIGDLYGAKILADNVADREGRPREALLPFMWGWLMNKYGLQHVAAKQRANILASIHHWGTPENGSVPRIIIFGHMCGYYNEPAWPVPKVP